MNPRSNRHVRTTAPAQTEALGEAIGRRLRGGETIELVSDLGGGKTTFVRGLARGAGSDDHVASPTFTLSKLYLAADRKIQIHHFDFYRLDEPGIMRDELRELVDDPEIVVVIEWSDIVSDILPSERLTIRFSADSENGRSITLEWPADLDYLIPEEVLR